MLRQSRRLVDFPPDAAPQKQKRGVKKITPRRLNLFVDFRFSRFDFRSQRANVR
jgi:hypothetical protein